MQLAALPRRHRGPALIVRIDRNTDRPAPELERLAAAYENGALVAAQEEPFWKEIARSYQHAPNLFNATLAWFDMSSHANHGSII